MEKLADISCFERLSVQNDSFVVTSNLSFKDAYGKFTDGLNRGINKVLLSNPSNRLARWQIERGLFRERTPVSSIGASNVKTIADLGDSMVDWLRHSGYDRATQTRLFNGIQTFERLAKNLNLPLPPIKFQIINTPNKNSSLVKKPNEPFCRLTLNLAEPDCGASVIHELAHVLTTIPEYRSIIEKRHLNYPGRYGVMMDATDPNDEAYFACDWLRKFLSQQEYCPKMYPQLDLGLIPKRHSNIKLFPKDWKWLPNYGKLGVSKQARKLFRPAIEAVMKNPNGSDYVSSLLEDYMRGNPISFLHAMDVVRRLKKMMKLRANQ